MLGRKCQICCGDRDVNHVGHDAERGLIVRFVCFVDLVGAVNDQIDVVDSRRDCPIRGNHLFRACCKRNRLRVDQRASGIREAVEYLHGKERRRF